MKRGKGIISANEAERKKRHCACSSPPTAASLLQYSNSSAPPPAPLRDFNAHIPAYAKFWHYTFCVAVQQHQWDEMERGRGGTCQQRQRGREEEKAACDSAQPPKEKVNVTMFCNPVLLGSRADVEEEGSLNSPAAPSGCSFAAQAASSSRKVQTKKLHCEECYHLQASVLSPQQGGATVALSVGCNE